MARWVPEKHVKAVCRECGWYIILTIGGHGDCLTPEIAAARLPPGSCPECGSDQVELVPATLMEQLSFRERRRAAEYIEKRRRNLSKELGNSDSP